VISRQKALKLTGDRSHISDYTWQECEGMSAENLVALETGLRSELNNRLSTHPNFKKTTSVNTKPKNYKDFKIGG